MAYCNYNYNCICICVGPGYTLDHKSQMFVPDKYHRERILPLWAARCGICSQSKKDVKSLRTHMNSEHNAHMCTLCIENKQAFPAEQKIYTPAEYEKHLRTGDGDGSEGKKDWMRPVVMLTCTCIELHTVLKLVLVMCYCIYRTSMPFHVLVQINYSSRTHRRSCSSYGYCRRRAHFLPSHLSFMYFLWHT
jgi:hypothetical protein